MDDVVGPVQIVAVPLGWRVECSLCGWASGAYTMVGFAYNWACRHFVDEHNAWAIHIDSDRERMEAAWSAN